jgi:hypothetical protein
LAIPFLCVALALMSVKIRQDRQFERAWYDLASMEMSWTISSEVKLVSNRTAWSKGDVDQLVETIEILRKRRDLGFTDGCHISSIDFKNGQISDQSLARIRHVLPNARINK